MRASKYLAHQNGSWRRWQLLQPQGGIWIISRRNDEVSGRLSLLLDSKQNNKLPVMLDSSYDSERVGIVRLDLIEAIEVLSYLQDAAATALTFWLSFTFDGFDTKTGSCGYLEG
jgi:hypothetical protein